MNVLDGVKSAETRINKEIQSLSEMVKDPSLSLVDRIESYEDIISMEVGDTSFNRLRNMERELNIRQLYIKYEGENPTGTQKDRIAFAQVLDALRRQFNTLTLATCGNYGVAMAFASYLAGIRCNICIPETYHTNRLKEMVLLDANIIRLPGTYEENVIQSSKLAQKNQWYDANPGGSNTALQLMAYAEIANEIFEELHDAPKYIAAPVSNGTLLAGIYRGFVKLYKRGKTSRIPTFLAGSASFKNPIVASFKEGLEFCRDIEPARIKETPINEPLINWHSFDGNEALYALQQTKGTAMHVSDKKMKDMSVFLHKKEGYRILPASTAGLIAMLTEHEKNAFENDRYVAVITGRY